MECCRNDPLEEFPGLTPQNYRVVSSPTTDYNCIAWSTGDTQHWWQPGLYWPLEASPDEFDLPALRRVFVVRGFEECRDSLHEPGFDKVALYADGTFYTHAARQLSNGKWTSKLGKAEDIEYDSPKDLPGGMYGSVVVFMKRPVSLPPTRA